MQDSTSHDELVFPYALQSGKESTLIVERFGGNMMSFHAEAYGRGDGGPADEPSSELVFQTQVMKVSCALRCAPCGSPLKTGI